MAPPSFFIAHGRSLPSVGFCRGKLAEPAQNRLRPCDFGSFRLRRRKPALRPPKLNYVAAAVVLLVAFLVGGVSGVVDRVLLDGRRPLTDRPRPGRRSHLPADTMGPVSTACFDSGPLRLPPGVGHALRQMGPPVRSDRAVGWDSFCLTISEMIGAYFRACRESRRESLLRQVPSVILLVAGVMSGFGKSYAPMLKDPLKVPLEPI
jgi:hypothetical protein